MGFGDELMVSGRCRELQQKDPRKVKLVFGKRLWNEVWDGNPRIATLDESGDFQTYEPRPGGLRPYIKSKSATRWGWLPYTPPVGEIYLNAPEKNFGKLNAGLVVVDPTLKTSASQNKQWPLEYWMELTRMLGERGLRPTQVGPVGARPLSGARLLETKTFRQAVAVLKYARLAILHEGGLHHAAAAVGCPAVVIFGGYISPAQTGYNSHVNLFTGGEPCGMRIPCRHCEEAMKKITPEQVLEEALKLCRESTTTHTPAAA